MKLSDGEKAVILIILIAAVTGAAINIFSGYGKKINVTEESFSRLPLDINTATAEQLAGLPGIGEKYAAAIVEFRDKNGGIKDMNSLLSVRGIGKARLAKLKKYTALNVNDDK